MGSTNTDGHAKMGQTGQLHLHVHLQLHETLVSGSDQDPDLKLRLS